MLKRSPPPIYKSYRFLRFLYSATPKLRKFGIQNLRDVEIIVQTIPCRISRGRLPKGSVLPPVAVMVERVGAVAQLVLNPVSGVGAGQGTQSHHPRQEPRIGVRFTGRDKLVHLIGKGEVAPCLERSVADRRRRSTGEIGQDFTRRSPPVVFRFCQVEPVPPVLRQGAAGSATRDP